MKKILLTMTVLAIIIAPTGFYSKAEAIDIFSAGRSKAEIRVKNLNLLLTLLNKTKISFFPTEPETLIDEDVKESEEDMNLTEKDEDGQDEKENIIGDEKGKTGDADLIIPAEPIQKIELPEDKLPVKRFSIERPRYEIPRPVKPIPTLLTAE